MPDTFERLKVALADRYAIEREIGASLITKRPFHPISNGKARGWTKSRVFVESDEIEYLMEWRTKRRPAR